MILNRLSIITCLTITSFSVRSAAQTGLQSSDLLKLRSVGEVKFSPDGSRLAYTVINNDGPARPYSQLWIMNMGDGKQVRLAEGKESSSNPEWSPDGQWIAYDGRLKEKSGLIVSRPDGSDARLLSPLQGTNSPLPSTGKSITWSPDGKRIAFVNAVDGPEAQDSAADPVVITRYLYKPDDSEGLTRFNDNRRLHIFVVEVGSGQIKQLTDGNHYEHSVEWSPNG